jgi:rhodanese-related sulfurtransferase
MTDAIIVDVRTSEEYAQGHVDNAMNIPLDTLGLRRTFAEPPLSPSAARAVGVRIRLRRNCVPAAAARAPAAGCKPGNYRPQREDRHEQFPFILNDAPHGSERS